MLKRFDEYWGSDIKGIIKVAKKGNSPEIRREENRNIDDLINITVTKISWKEYKQLHGKSD